MPTNHQVGKAHMANKQCSMLLKKIKGENMLEIIPLMKKLDKQQ